VLVLDHLLGVVPPLVARRVPGRRDGPLMDLGVAGPVGARNGAISSATVIVATVLHHAFTSAPS